MANSTYDSPMGKGRPEGGPEVCCCADAPFLSQQGQSQAVGPELQWQELQAPWSPGSLSQN